MLECQVLWLKMIVIRTRKLFVENRRIYFVNTNSFLVCFLVKLYFPFFILTFIIESAGGPNFYKIKRTDHQSFDFVKEICIFLPPKLLPCIYEMASKLSSQLANLTKAIFLSAQ